MSIESDIAKNFESIEPDIPKTAKLIAVSKQQLDDRIDAALKYGHRIYGENRVQEAQDRWAERKTQYQDLQLHLIGPLQTNKAKDAAELFDVIHTIDREKLARKMGKTLQDLNKKTPCFIQVNAGDEDQKSGIAWTDTKDFLQFCRDECDLNITGLMCIPPIDQPAGLYFALLKKYNDELGLPHLSMGMSSDYKKAIELGATHVRVGSAIFGKRPPRSQG